MEQKNTTPEALVSNREKELKEETLYKITFSILRNKTPIARPKEQNRRYCNAPNRTATPIAQPERRHAIIVKRKGISQTIVDLNAEGNKSLKKLRNPRRPKKLLPTNR